MEKQTPFGYRFTGSQCSIKLRFKEDKFKQAGLEKFGNYRYTKNGFILFEITLDTKSEDYKELSGKLNSMRSTD